LKILLATTNSGKIIELQELIAHYAQLKNLSVLSLKDMNKKIEVAEDQTTFYGNALKKAKEYHAYFKLPVIADDSGLVVPSLNGAPGVFSARYAGQNATDLQNIQLLLENLKSQNDKTAFFESSVVYYQDSETFFQASGKIYGQIIEGLRGTNGFGYDPVFFIPEKNKTMAELTLTEKNQISHRKQAFAKLLEQMITNQIH